MNNQDFFDGLTEYKSKTSMYDEDYLLEADAAKINIVDMVTGKCPTTRKFNEEGWQVDGILPCTLCLRKGDILITIDRQIKGKEEITWEEIKKILNV